VRFPPTSTAFTLLLGFLVDLRGKIIQAVLQLDTIAVSDLMGLLAQVRPTPAFQNTHPGIQ
jgi:hypothetical protein